MLQLAAKHNDPELKLGWGKRIGFGMASCGRGMLTGVLGSFIMIYMMRTAKEAFAMTADELWERSGLTGKYEAWSFAVCIIKTLRVYVTEFDGVPEEQAFKEGEGDRSLEYWRRIHENFLKNELAPFNIPFGGDTKVVCEEFETVYK